MTKKIGKIKELIEKIPKRNFQCKVNTYMQAELTPTGGTPGQNIQLQIVNCKMKFQFYKSITLLWQISINTPDDEGHDN